MLKNIMFPIKLNVHKCACGVEFAIIGLSNNCKDVWPHQGYAYCPYCGIANASQQPVQADAGKCICGGSWRTDGQHSNSFCDVCFKSRTA